MDSLAKEKPVKQATHKNPKAKTENTQPLAEAPMNEPETSLQKGLVCAELCRKGLKKARKQLNGFVQELVNTLAKDCAVQEVEFSISFDADGHFLGIGKGGASICEVEMYPCQRQKKVDKRMTLLRGVLR